MIYSSSFLNSPLNSMKRKKPIAKIMNPSEVIDQNLIHIIRPFTGIGSTLPKALFTRSVIIIITHHMKTAKTTRRHKLPQVAPASFAHTYRMPGKADVKRLTKIVRVSRSCSRLYGMNDTRRIAPHITHSQCIAPFSLEFYVIIYYGEGGIVKRQKIIPAFMTEGMILLFYVLFPAVFR